MIPKHLVLNCAEWHNIVFIKHIFEHIITM